MIKTVLAIAVITITLSLGLDTVYGQDLRDKLMNKVVKEVLNEENNKKGKAVILILSNTSWSGNITGSDLGMSTKDGSGDRKYTITCERDFTNIAQGVIQKDTDYGYLVVAIIHYGNAIDTQVTDAEYGIAHAVGECYNESLYEENIDDYAWISQWKELGNKPITDREKKNTERQSTYTKGHDTDDDFRIDTKCENGTWTGIITDSKEIPIPDVKVSTHKSIRTSNAPEGSYHTNNNGEIILEKSENHGYIKLERSGFNTTTTTSLCQHEPTSNKPAIEQIKPDTNKEIEIPSWVRSLADLWVKKQISDSEFATAIEFLIKQGIIEI